MFEPIFIVVLGALIGIVFGLLAWFLRHQSKRSSAIVKAAVLAALPEATITPSAKELEFSVTAARQCYLIKILPFRPDHELIVTNPTSWCINDKPRDWRRSSRPETIPGVAEFLAWKPQSDLPLVRIGVIVPNCHNITRYLNECDVEIVKPGDLVYGSYLMRVSDLHDFLAKAERK